MLARVSGNIRANGEKNRKREGFYVLLDTRACRILLKTDHFMRNMLETVTPAPILA